MSRGNLANVLGAVAIAISDEIVAGAERGLERGGATGAALNVIGHVPGLTIDAVANSLGLSHAGTVRLVDRLVLDGLVRREAGRDDKRTVQLHLSAKGRRKRAEILGERARSLDDALALLTAGERAALASIAGKLLAARARDPYSALHVCRYCDESRCPDCPVTAALDAS